MSDHTEPGSSGPSHPPTGSELGSSPSAGAPDDLDAPFAGPPRTEPPAAGEAPPFPSPAAGRSSTAAGPAFGPPAARGPLPAATEVEQAAPGWKAWVAAGAVAAVVAVGAAVALGGGSERSTAASGPASAATSQVIDGSGRPQGGQMGALGTAGTVRAVGGNTLTVTGPDGTETMVETSGATNVTRAVDGELSDLEVGDDVVVVGTDDGGAVAAQSITDRSDDASAPTTGDGPAGGAAGSASPPETPSGPPDEVAPGGGPDGAIGRPTAGVITEIDGDTITLETADGSTATITTSDGTTVSVAKAIAVADIAEGDSVVVTGEIADEVVIATSIRVGGLGARGSAMGAAPPAGMPAAPDGGDGSTGATTAADDPATVTGA